MFPSNLPAVTQKMHDAEMVRNLEAARHRAAHAAARRGQSSLRSESHIDISPA
jgi:hypothetical protein